MTFVRPRLESDLPALVEVLRAVHAADGYPDVWPPDPQAFVATPDPLGAWVAEVSGQPVGQVLLCSVGRTGGWSEVYGEGVAELAEIKRLFVSPAQRGLGLAQQLMQAALAGAAHRNLRPVLQTLDSNRAARRFYEQGGWHLAGTVRADWQDAGGQHPDMLLYTAP